MPTAAVPMIRTAVIRPLLDEMRSAGDLKRLMRRSNLPSDLTDRLSEFLPAHMVLDFMAECADHTGARDLSFSAGALACPERLGYWEHEVHRCFTLRSALQRFCDLYPRESSFLQMGLSEGRTHARLWRRRTLAPRNPAGEIQGEQFTLGLMLRLVRKAAGSQWIPPTLWTETPQSAWVLHTESFARSRVFFGAPDLAFSLPNELLDRRMPRATPCRIAPDEEGRLAASRDLSESLVQSMVPLAAEVPLSLEFGAEVAETSPRTLQRWLTNDGTSWRQIVDRVRFEACEKLLLDPSLTLTEISTTLGYSDQAHFTRAFIRWTGEAPSVRRRRETNEYRA